MTDNTEYSTITVKQSRGPRIRFQGKLLAESRFATKGRDPLDMILEVWETPAGALVAVSSSAPAGREGFEDLRALVVEPSENAQSMHFAVLDFFAYDNRARTMAKDMGWSMTLEVA